MFGAKVVMVVALLVGTVVSEAQPVIPMKFKSEEANKEVKETDSFTYYRATGDSTSLVALEDERLYYRLVSKKQLSKIKVEGPIVSSGETYSQHGVWRQYNEQGTIAIEGAYRRGLQVGLWQVYYGSGKIHEEWSFGIIEDKDGVYSCVTGAYNEYYANGGLKVRGYYTAVRSRVSDTEIVEDPVSGEKKNQVVYKSVYSPRKVGLWEYYDEQGELIKKEDLQ